MLITSDFGGMNMQPAPNASPFTFVSESRAHALHAEQNEDTILLDPRHGLAAIFDGMGSRKGADALGQLASQLGASVVHRGWERLLHQVQMENGGLLPCGRLDLPATLQQLIQEANAQIRAEGVRRVDTEQPPQLRVRYPKTTVVLMVLCQPTDEDGYTMVSAHVGDSRAYLLRGHDPLVRLSQDDGLLTTLIQSQTMSETDALRIDQAMQASQLSEAELEYFNKRYGVTQMLGDEQAPAIHIQQTPLLPGDRILLCSDGIHDNLLDQEIEELLRNGSSMTVASLLVERAAQRSQQDSQTSIRAKMDDMSALVVTYHHRERSEQVLSEPPSSRSHTSRPHAL
jgi:PPM family protein phosphatase